jgi:thiamine phosphate synthase YjbQ (UPF0047 family)
MATHHEAFEIDTEHRPSFQDMTERVNEAISFPGIKNGIAVVFLQHTTCSIIIQEDLSIVPSTAPSLFFRISWIY